MSAAALHFYDELRANGVPDDRARKIAEGVDNRREQDRKRAEEYADRAVAQSEEKSKATFATKDQTGKLVTRDEFNEFRKEVNGRLDSLTRFVAWGIVANITVVCIVGGIILRAVGGV